MIRLFSHRLTAWLIVVAACLAPSSSRVACRADDKDADQNGAQAQQVEAVFRGLLHERESLITGVCRVRGKKFAHGGTNPDVDGETRSLIAFDYAQGLFRYDNDDPAFRGRISSTDFKKVAKSKQDADELLKSTPQELVTLKLRYIRNADYIAQWFSTSDEERNAIHLFKPDAVTLWHDLARSHHLCDIRACGIMDFHEFTSEGFQGGKRVADYCTQLLSLPVDKVSKNAASTQVVLHDERWTRQLRIDNDGFCPVDYVITARHPPPETVMQAQAKWVKQSDVWVPKSLFTIWREPNGDRISYTFEYNWESVNTPVDPSYFDYHSFSDVPADFVYVIDKRPDKAEIMGNWRGKGVIEPLVRPTVQALTPVPKTWGGWIVMAGSGVLLAIVCLLYLLKRRSVR